MADKRKSMFDNSRDGRMTKEPTTTFLDRALSAVSRLTGMTSTPTAGPGTEALKAGLAANPLAVPKAVGGIFGRASKQLDEAARRRRERR